MMQGLYEKRLVPSRVLREALYGLLKHAQTRAGTLALSSYTPPPSAACSSGLICGVLRGGCRAYGTLLLEVTPLSLFTLSISN